MDVASVAQVVGAVPVPILVIGADSTLICANPAATALFGPMPAGRSYLFGLRHPGLCTAIGAALAEGVVQDARITLPAAARDSAFRLRVAPLAGGGGVVVSLEDLSELEQAGEMRRDFVANVSHELRTPLTALSGFIETLQGAARDDPAARRRFLEIMAREAGRMNRLVRDLLQLSRVEAEERLRPTDMVDVLALIRASVAALRPLSEAAGITVTLNVVAEPVPATLMIPADADQLVQVFHNLIENAIKYGGPDRPVRVEVEPLARDQTLRAPALRISVIDAGEGIDPVHLPRLSERFYRVDGHRSRDQGGTGLGLAIVKHIVNRHRGRMKIESTPGQGSRFSVILPV